MAVSIAEITVHVALVGDEGEDEALADSAISLSSELSELDINELGLAVSGDVPNGAKAVDLVAIGAFVVELDRSVQVLRQIVDAVRRWFGRSGVRNVRLEIDGDVLQISGASSAEIEPLVDAWIQRHAGP